MVCGVRGISRIAAAALFVTACTSPGSSEEVVVDRPPVAVARAAPLTLEEAGLVASGTLIEIYGLDADPVPVRVDGSDGVLDGQTMWRLDLRVEVSVDDERVRHVWEMWIGTSDDEDAAVLRAVRIDR